MPLTSKQERFVEEYMVTLNATDAARKVGYKHASTQGPRLLENVGVSAAIATAQAQRSQRMEVTQDYVISSIVETMERCKQAAPVLDRQGKPVMIEMPDGRMAATFAFDARGVLKGAELLGKHLGIFEKNKSRPEEPDGLTRAFMEMQQAGGCIVRPKGY